MKPLLRFFVYAFALFWIGFALAGVLIAIGAPPAIVEIVKVLMAWTPNFAFAIIYRRLGESRSLWAYVRELFTPRIRLLPLAASIVIPVMILLTVWLLLSAYQGVPASDLLADVTVLGAIGFFFYNLINGPLGEEIGWRGYAFHELRKRFSLLGSSLILGSIWGVRHLPLWFATSGYGGVELLLYIVFFVVGIISLSVVIGYVYRGRQGNLIYVVLLHQMFNFLSMFLAIDLLPYLGMSAAVYAVVAVIFVIATPGGATRRVHGHVP